MATVWHPDICDCQLTLGKDGEPSGFLVHCERHADSVPGDVAQECRDKEAARAVVQEELGLDAAPDWQRSEDGGHEIVLPEGLTKTQRATLASKLADIGEGAGKLATVSEIAAKVQARSDG